MVWIYAEGAVGQVGEGAVRDLPVVAKRLTEQVPRVLVAAGDVSAGVNMPSIDALAVNALQCKGQRRNTQK